MSTGDSMAYCDKCGTYTFQYQCHKCLPPIRKQYFSLHMDEPICRDESIYKNKEDNDRITNIENALKVIEKNILELKEMISERELLKE